MIQSQKEEKINLTDIFCKTCNKTTPHEIIKRKVGCPLKGEKVLGICIFCNNLILLSQTFILGEKDGEARVSDKI